MRFGRRILSDTTLMTPTRFVRICRDFVLISTDGFAGIPHPPVSVAPSWRLPPTRPSEALAKPEPTGALSTRHLYLAIRREIVLAAAACTTLRSLRSRASAACGRSLHHRCMKRLRLIARRHSLPTLCASFRRPNSTRRCRTSTGARFSVQMFGARDWTRPLIGRYLPQRRRFHLRLVPRAIRTF